MIYNTLSVRNGCWQTSENLTSEKCNGLNKYLWDWVSSLK